MAKPRDLPSKESLVWTLTTQVAGAASAVLFYSAIQGAGIRVGSAWSADYRPGPSALPIQREAIERSETGGS